MTKQYNSFEEIDAQLRILKLQREIDMESLKLKFNQVKMNLYPVNWMGSLSGLAQKIVLTFAIRKLSRLFQRRLPRTSE